MEDARTGLPTSDQHAYEKHHDHGHPHDHGYSHSHDIGGGDAASFLRYLSNHGAHHQEDYCSCLEMLKSDGAQEAAALLEESIMLLRQSNNKLDEALSLLEGE